MLSVVVKVVVALLVISSGVQGKVNPGRMPQRAQRFTPKQIQTFTSQVAQLVQQLSAMEQQVQSALHPSLPIKNTQSAQDDIADLQTAYNTLSTNITSLSTAVTAISSAYKTLQTTNATLTTTNTTLQASATSLTSQLSTLQTQYNTCLASLPKLPLF